MKKNIHKICSYCGYEKPTVDRNSFDGMCADCTDKSLYSEHISESAKKANQKLKDGYTPHICPCESTRMMAMCDCTTCDGIYFWDKD
jgi:hypothetical protein